MTGKGWICPRPINSKKQANPCREASQLSSGEDLSPQRSLLASSPPLSFSPPLWRVAVGAQNRSVGSATSWSQLNYLTTTTPSIACRLPSTHSGPAGSNWRAAAGSEWSSKCMAVASGCPSPASYHHQLLLSLISLLTISEVANQFAIGDKLGTGGSRRS
jgi:hypothetical protein